jgi:hypothetical protein
MENDTIRARSYRQHFQARREFRIRQTKSVGKTSHELHDERARARHYTDFSPEKLREIYEKAGLVPDEHAK